MKMPSLRFIRGGTLLRCGLKGCEKHAEFSYGKQLLCEKHARFIMVGQRIVSDENEARDAKDQKEVVDALLDGEADEPGGAPDAFVEGKDSKK
jgi:hypothetical protein